MKSRPLMQRRSWPTAGWFLWTTCALVLFLGAPGCSDDVNEGQDVRVVDAGADDDAAPADAGDATTADPDAGAQDVRRPSDTNNDWDFGLPDDDADASTAFNVRSVVPASGPVSGGNLVRIRGEGLEGDVTVYLGSRELAVEASAGELLARVPPAGGPGSVGVKAIRADGETATLPDAYRYVEALGVDEVSPERIPTEGGVQVDVRGAGFTPDAAVSFSGTPALRTEYVDASLLRVLAPGRARGLADVRVTTREASAVLEAGVEYYEPLQIDSVRPASSPVAGGALVVVEGRGFSSGAEFFFGGDPATVERIDPVQSTATVRAPPHPAGLVDVVVRDGAASAILADAFYYRAGDAPALLGLRPTFGSSAGGTPVQLVGYGFDAPGLRVEFGGQAAQVLDAEAGWAVVVTPPGAVGPVDVTLVAASGELARLEDAFEYRPGLVVDTATPASGPVEGGNQISVRGAGLANTTEVVVGGVSAVFSVVSDDELSVTAPAHGPGLVDLVVRANGIEGRLTDAYTYTEPLELWGFDPSRGAAAGGTYVAMRGRGFEGAIEVFFDDVPAPIVRRVDRNNLIVFTPAHPVGEAVVRVEAGGRAATGPYSYQYFDPASRFGGASGGPVEGAVNVSVFAQGAGPIPGAFVMLSTRADTPYQGLTNQNGQVTLSGPEVLGPQTVTATAAGYSATTVQAVDAENITVFLNQLNPDPSGGGGGSEVAFGTIEGRVTTPRKMADPDKQTTFDLARVATTRTGPFGGTLDPGPGGEVIGDGRYSIRSRVGDVAVVAVCGVYDERDGSFDPRFIGVERYLFVSDRGVYDVDLVCDIPLDKTARVKLVNPAYAPSGPDTNRARVFWDFGFEGVFEAPEVGVGLQEILEVPGQPAAQGALAQMTYTVVGGSYTGRFSPLTQSWVEDVGSLDDLVVLPPLLDVPEPSDPAPGGVVQNQTIRFEAQGPFFPDLYSVLLLNGQGIPFWQVILPGDADTIRLPAFPDFTFLPEGGRPEPYGVEQAFLSIVGVRGEGIRLDAFSYQDLRFDSWSAYSLNRWTVRFAQASE